MEESLLLKKEEGNVCTLTINRPEKRNSLNPEILIQIGDALSALKEQSGMKVVVLRGVGEKAFSSGYDIGRIPSGAVQPDPVPREKAIDYGLGSILTYPYPVIAMIYGYAVGMGLELAVTCDLRVAADNARLGITPAKLGVVYSHTGIRKFIDLVGVAQTKELFFTGRIIDAQRAREIGLVDHLVPVQDLEKTTYELAQEIAENAPLSVSGAKHIISKIVSSRMLDPKDEAELRQLRASAFESEDLKEGQKAFMEKRKPKFTGR